MEDCHVFAPWYTETPVEHEGAVDKNPEIPGDDVTGWAAVIQGDDERDDYSDKGTYHKGSPHFHTALSCHFAVYMVHLAKTNAT